MKKSGRFFIQALSLVCILSFVVMLGFDPAAKAQVEKSVDITSGNRGFNKVARNPDLESGEVSTIDVGDLTRDYDRKSREIGVGERPEGVVGSDVGEESEPNGTTATANALGSTDGRIKGSLKPPTDVDVYSITIPSAGRLYTATQTSSNVGSSSDTVIDVIGPDGTTVLETDDNDGSFSTTSATIAGLTLPSAGTYFIRVRIISTTGMVRPYSLYFAYRSATIAEIEPNNSVGVATALGSFAEASGSITPAADVDFFSVPLNAGDSVYLSLNSDPERDNVQWNGRLGFGLFGSGTPNQIFLSNDTSTGSVANPLSEAFFFTVRDSGTYFAYVDEAAAGAGNTYSLSVMVIPADFGTNCTTYSSSDVPKIIPTDPGLISSTLTVPPGSRRIESMTVFMDLNHTFMQDVDANLISPAANDNGLFTDVGSAVTGGDQTTMNWWIDDRAALPPAFANTAGFRTKPETMYRLDYFSGEDPTGVWTLVLRDDATGDGGNLVNWSLRICEQPEEPSGTQTIHFQDFETGPGGYTHSGTLDEWELGIPNTVATNTTSPVAAFQNCFSGTSCWKTDLDGTYELNSTQNLDSPAIPIPAASNDVRLSWAMRYQMENATFDHAWIEVFESGNPTNRRVVGEWDGPTMVSSGTGNPTLNIPQSAGWGVFSDDITDFAGMSVVVRFHLDSDNTVNFGGLAIDDVKITRLAMAVPSTVTGRVETGAGRAIQNVQVTLTEQNGTKHIALSNSFGYFRFFGILSQQNVTLSANSKRYSFANVPITLGGDTFVSWTGTPSP